MPADSSPQDVVDVARQLAAQLQSRGYEYALGGALALGYWANPRGTLDVDLTLFLPTSDPVSVVAVLEEIGCKVDATEAAAFIEEHGFCRALHSGFRVDVFLPTSPFYNIARDRRRSFDLEGQQIMVWDAECLAVFKMMFFREKDFVDIKQMLRNQGSNFDRTWVRQQLVGIFGNRDLRLKRWDEIDSESA